MLDAFSTCLMHFYYLFFSRSKMQITDPKILMPILFLSYPRKFPPRCTNVHDRGLDRNMQPTWNIKV